MCARLGLPATLQPAEAETRVGLQADRALFVVESSCFRNYLWLQGALAHNFVMVQGALAHNFVTRGKTHERGHTFAARAGNMHRRKGEIPDQSACVCTLCKGDYLIAQEENLFPRIPRKSQMC